jgi:phage shock protein PspC (stress-responsive transcriptional regulator)
MNKKLYLGNGYIGGVCEGLGEWSGIPSILWRIAFLFIFPYALGIYLALCFFVKRKNN